MQTKYPIIGNHLEIAITVYLLLFKIEYSLLLIIAQINTYLPIVVMVPQSKLKDLRKLLIKTKRLQKKRVSISLLNALRC